MRRVKVYGWTGWRDECPPAPNGSRQTREIVAARSWADVQRITGKRMGDLRHSGCETGNAEEIKIATANPGVVFWKPLDHYEVGGFRRLK